MGNFSEISGWIFIKPLRVFSLSINEIFTFDFLIIDEMLAEILSQCY